MIVTSKYSLKQGFDIVISCFGCTDNLQNINANWTQKTLYEVWDIKDITENTDYNNIED